MNYQNLGKIVIIVNTDAYNFIFTKAYTNLVTKQKNIK